MTDPTPPRSEDDRAREYLARSWWPPPPAGTPPTTASAPPPGAPAPGAPAPPSPGIRTPGGAVSTGRPASAWRSVGVAALGLVGGFLAAIVLQDVIGVAVIQGGEGTVSVGVGLLIAAIIPVLSGAGVVVALLIDRAARRREGSRDA